MVKLDCPACEGTGFVTWIVVWCGDFLGSDRGPTTMPPGIGDPCPNGCKPPEESRGASDVVNSHDGPVGG